MDRFWRGSQVLLVSGWLALMAGCVSQPMTGEGGFAAAVPLTNTYWQLQAVGGEAVADSAAGSEAHMILRDDGVVNGFSGCNAFRGEYEVINNRNLVFSSLASTRRACPPGGNPEQALFDAMAATAGVRMEERQLRLLDTDGRELAEFEATRQR